MKEKSKSIFFILNAPYPSGPIKGAYALANNISNNYKTYIVFLRKGPGSSAYLSNNIEIIDLSSKGNFLEKLKYFRNYLRKRRNIITFSMSFASDVFNLFLNKKIFKISSVRGNLIINEFFDRGLIGIPLAFIHQFIQRFYNISFVMNKSMARRVYFCSLRRPLILPNFIDEKALDKYFDTKINKSNTIKFIFVGQLSKRKNPILLINSIHKLLPLDIELNIIGDGPLYKECCLKVIQLGLQEKIKLHGYIPNPYSYISAADVFVMPSYSEGTSRAMLEALYLGIPCVVRDVDSNKDIFSNKNKCGFLFDKDHQLPLMLLKAFLLSRNRKEKNDLLPYIYKESNVINNLIKILEKETKIF